MHQVLVLLEKVDKPLYDFIKSAELQPYYGLSWIRPEGRGRIFYEAHGHHERIYAMRPMLEHVIAGIQYALGDLKADDSPSVKK